MGVRTNPSRRERGEQGTALVEFAIAVPLFFMLLLGMFSGGLAYNKRMQLTHAAREGARYGSTLPSDQANWATRVRDVVVNRSDGDLQATEVCVALVTGTAGTVVKDDSGANIEWRGNSAVFPSGCFADGNTDDGDRVHVAFRTATQIQWMIASSNVTLKGEATAKHE